MGFETDLDLHSMSILMTNKQNIWVVWDKVNNKIAVDGGSFYGISNKRTKIFLASNTRRGAKALKNYWFGNCKDFVIKKVAFVVE